MDNNWQFTALDKISLAPANNILEDANQNLEGDQFNIVDNIPNVSDSLGISNLNIATQENSDDQIHIEINAAPISSQITQALANYIDTASSDAHINLNITNISSLNDLTVAADQNSNIVSVELANKNENSELSNSLNASGNIEMPITEISTNLLNSYIEKIRLDNLISPLPLPALDFNITAEQLNSNLIENTTNMMAFVNNILKEQALYEQLYNAASMVPHFCPEFYNYKLDLEGESTSEDEN